MHDFKLLKSGNLENTGFQKGWRCAYDVDILGEGKTLFLIAYISMTSPDNFFHYRIVVDGTEQDLHVELLGHANFVLCSITIKFSENVQLFYADGRFHQELIFHKNGITKLGNTVSGGNIKVVAAKGVTTCPLLIGGAPKSGTTWVERTINSHPDIFITGENSLFSWPPAEAFNRFIKESPRKYFQSFFPENGFSSLHADLFSQSYSNSIFNLYAFIFGSDLVGDKTPSYSRYLSDEPNLLDNYCYIHCIRNPLDVAISRAYHEANLFVDSLNIDEAPSAQGSFKALKSGEITVSEFFTLTGFLENYISSWVVDNQVLRLHPEKVFLTIKYEDLANNFEMEVLKVFHALGRHCPISLIAEIKKKNSFEAYTDGRKPGEQDNQSFFRKGIVGDFVNVLSKDQVSLGLSVLEQDWPNHPYKSFFA